KASELTVEQDLRSTFRRNNRSMHTLQRTVFVQTDLEPKTSPIYKITPDVSSINTRQPPLIQTPILPTDTHSPPSTETTLSSTDIFHLTSIDTSSRTSIDTDFRYMVAYLVLVLDENGDLHDQEGHLHNAAGQKINA
ncbi:hypothetical protein IGI04_019314, partial [Brassica rapa subsp. trilocularis]